MFDAQRLDCHETKDGMQLWEFCAQESLKGRPIVQQMELLSRPISTISRPLANQALLIWPHSTRVWLTTNQYGILP